MTDDVRIAVGLPLHPKTKKLKKRLGAEGCWSLICLFLWAGAERWEGDLDGITDEDIELAADWDGEPGALVNALVEVRFLDGEAGMRRIHEWQKHNPFAAAKGARIAQSSRAAHVRWSKEDRRQTEAERMPGACPEHASSIAEQCPPTPAPAPAPAEQKEKDAHMAPRKSRRTPLPDDFAISDRVRQWSIDNDYGHLDEQFEVFVNKVRMHGYQCHDWDEFSMKAIDEDWANLRGPSARPAERKRVKL